MTRYKFLFPLSILSIFLMSGSPSGQQVSRPNVVMIFLDDGGFDDFSPFGTPEYPTPNVQQLAAEGCCFYNFYVPNAVCSASRGALLSGCYPGRTGVFGAHGPDAPGLDPEFATIGEVLKKNGYVTGFVGKWHIGDLPGRRPPSRGFDDSFGLMYSNDKWRFQPERGEKYANFPLHFWDNGEVIIEDVKPEDQVFFTTRYTERAVDFINRHSNDPFFLYVAHTMPHVPLYCSEKFKGKSGTGIYGDVIMEVDWSVGEIRKAINNNGLEDNTLFIFIGSDNGPWISYGDHSGVTPYREGKATIFDGGVRNSCIIKYPGKIKPNSISHNAFCSIDLLPTLCHITGSPLPENEIDGKNVWELILNKPGAKNPHSYYAFSREPYTKGVISADGKWKLHLAHSYRTVLRGGKGGFDGKYIMAEIDTSLFDMVHDPFEKINVIDQYPEIAETLVSYAKKHTQMFYSKQDK